MPVSVRCRTRVREDSAAPLRLLGSGGSEPALELGVARDVSGCGRRQNDAREPRTRRARRGCGRPRLQRRRHRDGSTAGWQLICGARNRRSPRTAAGARSTSEPTRGEVRRTYTIAPRVSPRAGHPESGGVAIGERRLGMSAKSVPRASEGAVAVARAERGTASERLGALITAQASVMLDHPHLCAPWWATCAPPLTCPTWRFRSTPPFLTPIQQLLDQGVADGSIRRFDDPTTVAASIFGAVRVIGLSVTAGRVP